jgi:hypothetical protein
MALVCRTVTASVTLYLVGIFGGYWAHVAHRIRKDGHSTWSKLFMEQAITAARRHFRRVGTRLLDRLRARREGWKDGRRGLPLLPTGPAEDGTVPAATPGFHRSLQARAQQVSEHHIARAIDEHAALIEEIRQRANEVVHRHDVSHDLELVHLGRFQMALGRWSAATQPHRAEAAVAVARANESMGWYWAVVLRRHRVLRRIRRGKQDVPMVPHPGGHAVELDLSRWNAAQVSPDPRWESPEQLLPEWAPRTIRPDQDHDYQPDRHDRRDRRDASPAGTLIRALQILRLRTEMGGG